MHILENDGERIIKPIADLEAAGVRLVIDHLGRPECGQRAQLRRFQGGAALGREGQHLGEAVGRLPAAVARDREDVCDASCLKTAGPERLFWGSDWPFAAYEDKVTYADTIRDFFDWIPDPVARRRIGGETAFKFYFS